MLVVKIENGNKAPMELMVNDLNDVATVQQSILREYQEVQKQDFKFDEERLLDNTPFSTIEDLEEWVDNFDHWDDIDELVEMKDCLDSSNYDSVDEMTERLEELESAIEDIYDSAYGVRR